MKTISSLEIWVCRKKKKHFLVFHLKTPAVRKAQIYPVFAILEHSIGVYFPTHELVTITIDHHV